MADHNHALLWLQVYLQAHGCHLTKQDDLYAAKLTRTLDEQLMNRPFYWKYMDTIGNQGEPNTIYFHRNKTVNDDKYIHTDHQLLVRIFHELKQSQQFIVGYEQIKTTTQQVLHPYFFINTIIRYEGKHVKEEIHSVGINLINGRIVRQMMDQLNELSISEMITPLCYIVTPIISLQRAYHLIDDAFDEYIQQISHQWAIDTFDEQMKYKQLFSDNTLPSYFKQIFQPKITFKTISSGILYLHPQSCQTH